MCVRASVEISLDCKKNCFETLCRYIFQYFNLFSFCSFYFFVSCSDFLSSPSCLLVLVLCMTLTCVIIGVYFSGFSISNKYPYLVGLLVFPGDGIAFCYVSRSRQASVGCVAYILFKVVPSKKRRYLCNRITVVLDMIMFVTSQHQNINGDSVGLLHLFIYVISSCRFASTYKCSQAYF